MDAIHMRSPGEAADFRQFHRQDITHKGTIRVVCKQTPLLVGSHAEDRSRTVKLYLPRFLREAPCGIASAADAH